MAKKWSQGKENGRAWNLLTDYRAWKVWVIRWFLHLDLANTAPGSPWKSTRRECLRISLSHSLFLNLYKIRHLDTCNSCQRFCKVKVLYFTSPCVCWSSQGRSLANSKWHSAPEASVKPQCLVGRERGREFPRVRACLLKDAAVCLIILPFPLPLIHRELQQ